MSVRTLDEFLDALDREIAWRQKEILSFNLAVQRMDSHQSAFIRAGVALLYAHWEGFIKSSSELYLRYVENRRLPYTSLKTCFAIFGLKGKLNTLKESRSSAANVAALDFILSEMSHPAKMKISSAINTGSNLSSKTFKNIASSIDIDTERYSTKFNFIDDILLDRRNKIAHGEYIRISSDEFSKLLIEVSALMRTYKTDLETAASNCAYKRSAS